MNKNKHTPGPWHYTLTDDGCTIRSINGSFVVQTLKNRNEDAALIVAAPEMLEALENTLRLLQSIERENGYVTLVTQQEMQKLIKKAKGE